MDVEKALALIKTGIEWLRSSVNVTYYRLTIAELVELTKNIATPFPLDLTYQYTDISTMKRIIKIDWTNTKKYKKDIYDCDNFAFMFASRMAEIWDINAVGVAFGLKNGIPHFWNYFIAKEHGDTKVFSFEPQTDEINPSGSYKPMLIIWF